MFRTILTCTVLTSLLLVGAVSAVAEPTFDEVYPKKADPFLGNYVGRWSEAEEVNPDIAAQVYPLGNDSYRIRIVNKLDMRCPVLLDVEVQPKRGKLEFDVDGFTGKTDGETFTGTRGELTYSMQESNLTSPTMHARPPEGGVVLFDGTNLDAWTGTEGWQILDDGTLLVTPEGDYLVTKDTFTDVQLHVEFRLPLLPLARGQGRGNSGVFLQDEYEVQVLDSFGLDGLYDECGALYKLSAPHVNACRPPLQWQTYDIYYRAARFDASGNLQEYGRISVFHNGVLIHSNQELSWRTGWKEVDRLVPPPSEPGHIKLQGHDNFVQYRNIWVVK
ncbi:MAG: hypothetical protein AMXMBFR82_01020 [Candidatus Hydrogenedentota bacterium]